MAEPRVDLLQAYTEGSSLTTTKRLLGSLAKQTDESTPKLAPEPEPIVQKPVTAPEPISQPVIQTKETTQAPAIGGVDLLDAFQRVQSGEEIATPTNIFRTEPATQLQETPKPTLADEINKEFASRIESFKSGFIGGREDRGVLGNTLDFFVQDVVGIKPIEEISQDPTGLVGAVAFLGNSIASFFERVPRDMRRGIETITDPDLQVEVRNLPLIGEVALPVVPGITERQAQEPGPPFVPFLGQLGLELTPEEQATGEKVVTKLATDTEFFSAVTGALLDPTTAKSQQFIKSASEFTRGFDTWRDAFTLITADPFMKALALIDIVDLVYIDEIIQGFSAIGSRAKGVRKVVSQADEVATKVDDVVEVGIRQVDEVAEGAKELADNVVKRIRTQVDEVFDDPNSAARLLDEGVTPRQARQALDDLVETEARIVAREAEIARLKDEAAELIDARRAEARNAVRVDKERFIDETLPRKLAAAENRLDVLSRAPERLASSVTRSLSNLSGPLADDITSLFAPILQTRRAGGQVALDEVTDLIEEARVLVRTASDEGDDIAATAEVRELENTFKQFEDNVDEFGLLANRLAAGGQQIRQEGLARLAQSQQRRLARVSQGPVATLQRKIDRLEGDLSSLRERRTTLAASPIVTVLRSAQSAGIEARRVISPRGVITSPEYLSQFDTLGQGSARDLSRMAGRGSLSMTDPTRAAQTLDGSFRGPRMREIVEPAIRAKAARLTATERKYTSLQKLLREAKIRLPGKSISGWVRRKITPSGRKAVEASKRMFRAAEGKSVRLSAEERAIVDWSRNLYDNYLDRINAQRAKLNVPLIPKRENYVTHLKEMDVAERMGLSLIDSAEVADPLVVTQRTKQRASFFSEKARTGAQADEDLVGSVMAYIDIAERELNMNPVAAKINAIVPNLPGANERVYWQRFVNEAVLEGETVLDRFIDTISPIRLTGAFSRFSGMTSRGALLGNINVMALQPTTFFINPAKFRTRHLLKGSVDLLTDEGRQFVIDNSPLRKIRDFESIDVEFSNLTKVEDAMNYFTKKLDMAMFDVTWAGAYRGARHDLIDPRTGKHFDHESAVRYADIVAGQTQAMYDKLLVPPVLRSKTGRVLGQFGTFPVNLWKQLTTDIRNVAGEKGALAATKQFLTLLAGMTVANVAYDAAGLQKPYDFISDDPEEAVRVIPFVGGVRTFGPPIILKDLGAVFNIIFGDERDAKRGFDQLKKDAVLLVPFGNQARKTIKGIQAISDGYTSYGNEKIPIEGLDEEVRAILFGPWGTEAARDFFDERE